MCKMDLNDAYFSVPLNPASKTFVQFLWSGKVYRFLCFCFGLGPVPRIFYKITQNSSFIVALPEHTNYNLLGRHVVDRPYNRRNVNGQRHSNLPSPTTTAYTEFKEISVDAYTENRVPRGIVDSLIMTLSLPEKKVSKVQKQCQELLQKTQVSILELTKLICLLSSTIQSVLPAQINFRYVQQQKIQALKT